MDDPPNNNEEPQPQNREFDFYVRSHHGFFNSRIISDGIIPFIQVHNIITLRNIPTDPIPDVPVPELDHEALQNYNAHYPKLAPNLNTQLFATLGTNNIPNKQRIHELRHALMNFVNHRAILLSDGTLQLYAIPNPPPDNPGFDIYNRDRHAWILATIWGLEMYLQFYDHGPVYTHSLLSVILQHIEGGNMARAHLSIQPQQLNVNGVLTNVRATRADVEKYLCETNWVKMFQTNQPQAFRILWRLSMFLCAAHSTRTEQLHTSLRRDEFLTLPINGIYPPSDQWVEFEGVRYEPATFSTRRLLLQALITYALVEGVPAPNLIEID